MTVILRFVMATITGLSKHGKPEACPNRDTYSHRAHPALRVNSELSARKVYFLVTYRATSVLRLLWS